MASVPGDFDDGHLGGGLVGDGLVGGEGGDQRLQREVVDGATETTGGLVDDRRGVVGEQVVGAPGEGGVKGIWAADLLVVQTINYRILYVFFFTSHDRRELIHFNVTASPTAAWIWHQLLEATPWGRQPAYLIHDRDAVYCRDFDARTGRLGIAGVRTPKANSIAERLVGTIRRQCLDHLVVINEHQLQTVLAEFMNYYNHDRPHRTLALQSPVPNQSRGRGPVVSTPVLGGLHHAYARAA